MDVLERIGINADTRSKNLYIAVVAGKWVYIDEWISRQLSNGTLNYQNCALQATLIDPICVAWHLTPRTSSYDLHGVLLSFCASSAWALPTKLHSLRFYIRLFHHFYFHIEGSRSKDPRFPRDFTLKFWIGWRLLSIFIYIYYVLISYRCFLYTCTPPPPFYIVTTPYNNHATMFESPTT